PQRPTKRDTAMRSAGHGRWTLGVTMTRSLSHYKYWNLGVKIGSTIHVVKIRVS
ncbi:MAG: large repetitive protein, partial [Pseudonocardiales bacterium]|nr:large repetitive protein [Pseudonocardiales bacterium]